MSRDRAKSSQELSEEQRDLLALILEEDGVDAPSDPRIPRRSDPDAIELSHAQKRLWFLHQLDPESAVYTIASVHRLEGVLDTSALASALVDVWYRHEVLRTRYPGDTGLPAAERVDGPPPTLARVDLAGLPEERREMELHRWSRAEARRPFDLGRDVPIRALLFVLGRDHHAIELSMHHIVADGWSRQVLIRELGELYRARLAGEPPRLRELPIQYGDYAAWQQRRLSGRFLEAELEHWRTHLEGLPVLQLPFDRPRPPVQTFRGSRVVFDLPASVSEPLLELGRRSGASLYMVLLALFQLLMHRVSGQPEVAVGTLLANRERPELQDLIGFLVNTLVIRGRIVDRESFRDLLGRVRETTLEASSHGEVPFELLVDELQPDRDLSHTPLFQVMFSSGQAPPRTRSLPGLTLTDVPLEDGTAKFDLNLFVLETGAGLRGWLEYSTDLFDETTVRRLADYYGTLARAVAEGPDRTAAALPMLSPAQVHQVTVEWNDLTAGAADRASLPVDRRFEEHVRDRPDAVAVVYGDEQISYRELDRRAAVLAGRLAALGVGPGVRVGLCLHRSTEWPLAILAVLRAGAAYVPLDPEYPRERLELVVRDAGIPVLLVQGDAEGTPAELAAPEDGVRLLDVRRGTGARGEATDRSAGAAGGGAAPAESASAPEGVAYVIYTSGSTGRPKGVPVAHANVASLFDAAREHFSFGPEDVWTLFHSYAFDFSVWEMWGALAHGGRLVVVPREVTRAPEAFHRLLARERVTVLNQTPSAFRTLIRADEGSGDRLALDEVVFGGEALEIGSLRPWFERHGDRRPRLVNMYGITETTVHVSFRALSRADTDGGSVIGRALPHLQVHVLDPHGRRVPIGVTGEVLVGGDGVAGGYLGRPSLTAERFVPDPFSERPGARLYRSGDLARLLPTGDLEYQGRADHQVKVRGFRIELGEIEAALGGHPGVREVVVVARDEQGGARLVAYTVGASDAAPTVEGLRDHLRERLPEHMVPHAFVALDSMPLTPEGKIDRRALPDPGAERPDLVDEYVAPRTLEEQALAAIWQQVLGVERVGLDDNFFSLGGDSIRSVEVLAKARERGLDLSLQDLFRLQTVRGLATRLHHVEAEERATERRPFALLAQAVRDRLPEGVEDAYPLSRLQSGMLYHMELTPEEPLYHNVVSFHLEGFIDPEALQGAIDRVVARHPVLRTSFDMTSFEEPIQRVHADARLELTVEDLRPLPEAETGRRVQAFVDREKTRLFDLTRPPQLRLALHLRTEGSFQLTVTENHAILDGWSLHSTLAEIFELYGRLTTGEALPDLEPPQVAFRDFIVLERKALDSDETRAFLEGKAADAKRLELPAPRPPADGGPRKRIELIRVPAPVAAGLRETAGRLGVPLKSVLLAAHVAVLDLLTPGPDVITGLVAHGRPEDSGGEQVRGLFLNTLPLRTVLREGTWADLVHQAFEAEWELLPHRRYPLAALQERFGDQPLFEVAFNYIHFHVVAEVVGTGRMRALGFQSAESTNFALTVNFRLSADGEHLSLDLEHDRYRIGPSRLRALRGYYLRALAALSREPDARRSRAALTSRAERHQVLVEWGGVGRHPRARPPAATLTELFRDRVRERPDAVALTFRDRAMTYGALDRRASALAERLRAAGVGPETRVGLCLERGLDLVVAILAVLRAGGAYVPLDPAHPRERSIGILADAGAELAIAGSGTRDLVASSGLRVIGPDAGEEAEPAAEPVAVDGASAAYVIYTSGSTGTPKGVVVPHDRVTALLQGAADHFDFGPDDVWTLFHSYAFDFSVWELWGALGAGGRLVIVPAMASRSPEELRRLLAAERVTVLNQTPSAFRQLIRADGDAEDPLALREVIFGGEALEPGHLAPWFERHGTRRPRLVNMYGITETTVHVTFRPLGGGEEAGTSAIGRALPHLTASILDAGLRPLPVGVPGEIHVGGAGVARGYLGRPALTAERFVPDPYGHRPGARLYRSGDLARFRPDGDLEYLGRLDQQIKIRGFRIELGEIEAACASHPGVADAVVTMDRRGADDARLCAYVVPAAGEEVPGARALREHVGRTLPQYMVPSDLVVLDAIPLTANGKLDRAALPEPSDDGGDERFAAPRTPVEEVVAGIWAEVLGRDRVGVRDDFFELGGHSLLATRVVARLRDVFDVELPLKDLFDRPTVEGLAQVVAARRGGAGPELPAPTTVRADGEAPLSFTQEQMWLVDQLNPGTPAYNLPAYARIFGALVPRFLLRSLRAVEERHQVLRARFVERGGSGRQVVAEGAGMELPVVDLSRLEGASAQGELVRLARDWFRLPFDLQRGPLARGLLTRIAPAEHALLVTMHHIVGDGWSMGVLLAELGAAYAAAEEATEPELEPLPLQYPDFALWQRRHLDGGVMEERLAYWRERLAGELPRLDALMDRPAPEEPTFLGGGVPLEIPLELTRELEGVGRRAGATLFMTVLAAYKVLLSVRSGVTDLLIGAPVAGRGHRELEPLIGPFLNTVVLRTDLGGNPTYADLLHRVRAATLEGYAHQDVPFERIVNALGIDRGAGSPIYQSWFNYMSAPMPEPAMGTLRLAPLPVDLGVTKFDLALNLRRTSGGLHGTFEYSRDRLDRSTVEEMADQLPALLAAAAERPETTLAELASTAEAVARRRREERERSAKQHIRAGIRAIQRRSSSRSTPSSKKG